MLYGHATVPVRLPVEVCNQYGALTSEVKDSEARIERLLEQRSRTFNAAGIEAIDADTAAMQRKLEATKTALTNVRNLMRAYQHEAEENERAAESIMLRVAGLPTSSYDTANLGKSCDCDGIERSLDQAYGRLAEAELKLRDGCGSSRGFYERQRAEAQNLIHKIELEFESGDEAVIGQEGV